MESITSSGFSQLADSLYRKGSAFSEIVAELRMNGAPENELEEIIRKLKNFHFSKKRKSGFFWCSIGVLLMIAGCLLTLFLFSSGNIRFVMYGLTSLGIVCTLKGLVDLMGW